MIFYVLLFYVLLLVFSAVFFVVKKFYSHPIKVVLSVPHKKVSRFYLWGKVKVSRFITQYECPECGFKSMEVSKSCPQCMVHGKETSLVANTMILQ